MRGVHARALRGTLWIVEEEARRGRPPGPEPAHGTRARYQWSQDPCHRECCRAAWAREMLAYRHTGSTKVTDAGPPVR